MKELPNSPIGSESKEQVADYVELVMNRVSRPKALKQAYPERYARAVSRASGNDKVVDANIKKEYNQIERSKYAQGLFTAADKMWWVKFLDRKQDIYDKLYDIATNDDEDTKDQISSARALLQYLPTAPREDKLEVTHKVHQESFKDMLNAKKKELHSAANGEAIDVEVVSNE